MLGDSTEIDGCMTEDRERFINTGSSSADVVFIKRSPVFYCTGLVMTNSIIYQHLLYTLFIVQFYEIE